MNHPINSGHKTLLANQNKPAGGYNAAGGAVGGATGGANAGNASGTNASAANSSSAAAFEQSREANHGILGGDLDPSEQESTTFGYTVGPHNGNGNGASDY